MKGERVNISRTGIRWPEKVLSMLAAVSGERWVDLVPKAGEGVLCVKDHKAVVALCSCTPEGDELKADIPRQASAPPQW